MRSYESVRNTIICGDALATMRDLPDACVDVVVTSPPYNIKNSTGNGLNGGYGKWKATERGLTHGYDTHADNMPHVEYVAWQTACLREMLRLIPNHGAIFYNHKWRVQDGLLQDRADIVAGLPVRQIIIWKRAGGHLFNRAFFLPTYEVIYLIAKPGFRLADKTNAWGDVWEFGQELHSDHPAAFPLELPSRCIRAADAQIVLDPFVGSGTTAVAAKLLGREYVGIELSPHYAAMAEQWLNETIMEPQIEQTHMF